MIIAKDNSATIGGDINEIAVEFVGVVGLLYKSLKDVYPKFLPSELDQIILNLVLYGIHCDLGRNLAYLPSQRDP